MLVSLSTYHSGFGLIEVLVALVVFSLGVLVTYNVQVSALSNYHQAAEQLTAASIVRDIISRIRSNSGQLERYSVEGLGVNASLAEVDCRQVLCSPTQLVEVDLSQLAERIQGSAERFFVGDGERNAGGLADARACISSNGRLLTVVLSWTSKGIGLVDDTSQCSSDVTATSNPGSFTSSYAITSYIGVSQ